MFYKEPSTNCQNDNPTELTWFVFIIIVVVVVVVVVTGLHRQLLQPLYNLLIIVILVGITTSPFPPVFLLFLRFKLSQSQFYLYCP